MEIRSSKARGVFILCLFIMVGFFYLKVRAGSLFSLDEKICVSDMSGKRVSFSFKELGYHVEDGKLSLSGSEKTFLKGLDLNELNEGKSESTDASLFIDKDTGTVTLIGSKQGEHYNEDEAKRYVKGEIERLSDEILNGAVPVLIILPESLYEKPSVQTEDLKPLYDEYQAFLGREITYTFGPEKRSVTRPEILRMLTESGGHVDISRKEVLSFVSTLALDTDTTGRVRLFLTQGGETVTFSKDINTYGYAIDLQGETEQLIYDLKNSEKVVREPLYSQEGLSREGEGDLASYVEVSLSRQKLWLVKNGEIILTSDLVSGNHQKGKDTSTGVWTVEGKASPAVLRGSDAEGSWNSPVTYWMPFHDGQGLHDASWRSSFGGDIYLTNGSHGCVNLPLKSAGVIYETVCVGFPVIIY